jgi:hypothetical protein
MAPGQKLYPRATVKKIVKAHSNCNVSKNVDVTVSETLTVCSTVRDLTLMLTRLDIPRLRPLYAIVGTTTLLFNLGWPR